MAGASFVDSGTIGKTFPNTSVVPGTASGNSREADDLEGPIGAEDQGQWHDRSQVSKSRRLGGWSNPTIDD